MMQDLDFVELLKVISPNKTVHLLHNSVHQSKLEENLRENLW